MIVQRVGIPIYLQVKDFILEKIKSGAFRPGGKIPTERELSAELGISRNTVSAAYKELLLEDVLEARQGRGTFVKVVSDDIGGEIGGSRRGRLMKIIDDAMAKVLELGFTVDQFAAIASIRAQEKAQAVKELRVAVVDCTAEYIQRFISQIGQVANVHFESVILSDLVFGKVQIELLQACDVVVTTFEHQAVVTNLMGSGNKIITVAAVPYLEAVIKLARLPVDTKVAIVARSKEFKETLEILLEKAAINHLNFVLIQSDDRKEISSLIADYDVFVVSEEREVLVTQLVAAQKEVITFYYEIDRGSLNQVMMKLVSQAM
ncbi:GntR family transcriptional regulator [Pelosinus sp. sgz500959]|uniref:GntR family transcriptional regulator n=1 Tax=Pelosinus sp. sgz500959 TaxID=3242472 RepID=UPI00366F7079